MLSRMQLELATCAAVFALGALSILGAMEHSIGWADDGPQAGYFPFRLGLVLVLASLAIAVQTMRDTTRGPRPVLTREGGRRMIGFFLPIVAYVAVAQVLGLYVATALYLCFVLRMSGRHPWHTCLAVAAAVPVISWFLFEVWFTVPLLKGPVEAWLGLA